MTKCVFFFFSLKKCMIFVCSRLRQKIRALCTLPDPNYKDARFENATSRRKSPFFFGLYSSLAVLNLPSLRWPHLLSDVKQWEKPREIRTKLWTPYELRCLRNRRASTAAAPKSRATISIAALTTLSC